MENSLHFNGKLCSVNRPVGVYKSGLLYLLFKEKTETYFHPDFIPLWYSALQEQERHSAVCLKNGPQKMLQTKNANTL